MRILARISIVVLCCASVFAADPGLHMISTYKLGGEGGWDYLTIDPDSRRVFIAHGTRRRSGRCRFGEACRRNP
jgi:hypothetical protein